MSEETLPHILIVDDEDTSQHVLGLDTLAATRARHPKDVDIDDLDWADLVLMDFIIGNWTERDDLEQISLRPRNGLALAAVLESTRTPRTMVGTIIPRSRSTARTSATSRGDCTRQIRPVRRCASEQSRVGF